MNEGWCTYPAPPPPAPMNSPPPPPFPLPLHSPLWGGGGQPPTMALKNNFARVTVELLVERSDLGPPTWSPRGGGGGASFGVRPFRGSGGASHSGGTAPRIAPSEDHRTEDLAML